MKAWHFGQMPLPLCSSCNKDERMAHLSATIAALLIFFLQQGETLKCYSTNDSVAQQQWTQCDDRKGFRTCFTKYNMRGQVTARGCATKDKVFHIECENHVMGANSEKFCYCSYYLCNGSRASPGKSGSLALFLALLWSLDLLWRARSLLGQLPSGPAEPSFS